jgi:hypothetical protein
MGIFEKFRTQPRWKHADPSVRMAAIYELGTDEQAVLSGIVRDDPEARVRRAAVSRLDDVATLGEVLRTDPDGDVRAEAQRRLIGLAAETSDADVARAVVAQLLDAGLQRELVVVARDSTDAGIKAIVVEALTDSRALGAISRQATDGPTRLLALSRISDSDELCQVALRSEYTDSAVAAFGRLIDPSAIAAIAQRARNKVVMRKARARERLLEEALRAVRPAPAQAATAMSPEDRQRAASLVAEAEALVATEDPALVEAGLTRLRVAWAELQADTDVDPSLQGHFDSALESVREAMAARAAERQAEEERRKEREREAADRVAVCEAIETLDGADALDRFAELKVQWDGLPPLTGDYSATLTRRFQDACRRFEESERRRGLAAVAAERLETLAAELEQLVASEQALPDVLARWRMLRRDADMLREMGDANPPAAERVERAVATLEEKEHEQQQIRAKEEQDNLKRLQQLSKQVETLAGSEHLTLKAGDRALNDIRDALETRRPLPTKGDRQEIQARLEAARVRLAPRVQELRDADEWQRWANLQVQEELARQMETLSSEANLELAARKMRELQGRWKTVALAPRTQGEAMWRRFKAAQEQVFARTSAYMAAQHEARKANVEKKRALCEQAEALAPSSDWVKTAAALQALQSEWKAVGPASRGHEKALWERFRAACDGFFSRRQEDLKKRKDEWSANLAQKEALCAEAERLSQSTDWEAAAAQLKRLQAQWKSIGPVRRAKSEVVWQRFRTACDAFFDRYKHRDQIEMQEKAAARTQVIADLEALVPPEAGAPPPEGLLERIQRARAAWQQAPELARSLQQDLAVKYHDVLARLVSAWPQAFAGSELDPDHTRKRMEKLLARVEQLSASHTSASQPVAASPAELLAQRWRERLAANTMSGGQSKNLEETKWREAEQEVRSAQQQWMRLGPVPATVAGPLNERFQRACRKFYDGRRRAS